ncbi:MAG: hypothetical protein ACKOFW_21515, partial [Planctomycetaceae bacterium]
PIGTTRLAADRSATVAMASPQAGPRVQLLLPRTTFASAGRSHSASPPEPVGQIRILIKS